MLLTRLTAMAQRFLTERSFTLIVEPTLADFEFGRPRRIRPGDYVALFRAVAGAAYEDATSESGAVTFLALALIPAAYYAFFFMLCAPEGMKHLADQRALLVLGALVVVASMIPVLVCYWPERSVNRES
jgi:hypothetical protein